jgi:hypothetical protein
LYAVGKRLNNNGLAGDVCPAQGALERVAAFLHGDQALRAHVMAAVGEYEGTAVAREANRALHGCSCSNRKLLTFCITNKISFFTHFLMSFVKIENACTKIKIVNSQTKHC